MGAVVFVVTTTITELMEIYQAYLRGRGNVLSFVPVMVGHIFQLPSSLLSFQNCPVNPSDI